MRICRRTPSPDIYPLFTQKGVFHVTEHFRVPEGDYEQIEDFYPFEPSDTLLSVVHDWIAARYEGNWLAAAFDAQIAGARFYTVPVEGDSWSFHGLRNEDQARLFYQVDFGLFAPSLPTAVMVLSWMFLEANWEEVTQYIHDHEAAHTKALD